MKKLILLFTLCITYTFSNAQIVQVSFTNHTAYLNQGTIMIDINQDGSDDFGFNISSVLQPTHETIDIPFMGSPNNSVACVPNVSPGTHVHSGLSFQYYNGAVGAPINNGNTYIAFRFISGNDTLFGYMSISANVPEYITLNYYVFQSNPGQSIYVGDVNEKTCSALSVENIPANCNGSDLKLHFNYPADTNLVSEFRAMIVNLDNTTEFELAQALLVPDSLCTLFQLNDPDSIVFNANSRSVDGLLINIFTKYRIYILTEFSNGMQYLSLPTSRFELACTARPASNITISDVGDDGNAHDIMMEFDMQDAFCVSQVKPVIVFSSNNLTLSDVYSLDNLVYPNVTVSPGINSYRFPDDAVDYWGDVIESNTYTYKVFLVSIPLAGCKDSSISAPSNLLFPEVCNPLPYLIGDSSSSVQTYIIDTLLSYDVPLNVENSVNLDMNSDGTYDFVFYYKKYQGMSNTYTTVSVAGLGLIKCDITDTYAIPFNMGDSICSYLNYNGSTSFKIFYKITEGSTNLFEGFPIGYAYVVKIWDSGSQKIGWIRLSESSEGLRIYSLSIPNVSSVPDEELNHQARVFPNPASQFVHIVAIDDSPYIMINSFGSIVQTGFVRDQMVSIVGVTPGVYILQIMEAGSIVNKKIVIEN